MVDALCVGSGDGRTDVVCAVSAGCGALAPGNRESRPGGEAQAMQMQEK